MTITDEQLVEWERLAELLLPAESACPCKFCKARNELTVAVPVLLGEVRRLRSVAAELQEDNEIMSSDRVGTT